MEVLILMRTLGDPREAPRPTHLLLINWDHWKDTAVDFTISNLLALAHQLMVIKNVMPYSRHEEAAKAGAEGPL